MGLPVGQYKPLVLPYMSLLCIMGTISRKWNALDACWLSTVGSGLFICVTCMEARGLAHITPVCFARHRDNAQGLNVTRLVQNAVARGFCFLSLLFSLFSYSGGSFCFMKSRKGLLALLIS